MTTVVNNQDTREGDNVFYVDANGEIHDAVVKNIVERDGNHYAELAFERDGKKRRAVEVPHNTSAEKHSWNHPLSDKERETHYKEDFYGSTPDEPVEQESYQESKPEERDYSALERDETEEEGAANA